MTMMSDGIAAEENEQVENLDLAELLDQSIDYSRTSRDRDADADAAE